MKEENKAVIKAINMYGRVPEMWELLEEIERLNNIINELDNWLEENRYHIEEYDGVLTYLRKLKGDDKE